MDETIIRIELDRLRESPTNPRRHFDAASLGELSLSIASQGVIEPIIVRPAPDRPGDQRNLQVTHEIVVGHRRYRASLLAKQLDIPCVVRDLDDEQVRLQQIHENLHREDVNPIEEADGFTSLAKYHGVKVDQLVKDSGKSRSYVYGRMRLATAAPEVREAVLNEGLGGEVATRIARIPSHKLQKAALDEARQMEYDVGTGKNVQVGWISDREAKRKFSDFTISLEAAPFDLADEKLAALAGACTTCPKRAGNEPDLASDLAADTCTDTECYSVKVSANTLKLIAAAKKAGRKVYEGDEAKAVMPSQYGPLEGFERASAYALNLPAPTDDDPEEEVDLSWLEAIERIGKKAPKPALLVHPYEKDKLVDIITTVQAQQILALLGQAESGSTPSTAAQAQRSGVAWPFRNDVPDADASPEERALSMPLWTKVQAAVMDAVCARKDRTADELLLVARAMLQDRGDVDSAVIYRMGWSEELEEAAETQADFDDEEHWCLDRLTRCDNVDDIARFVVLMAVSCMPVRYGKDGMAEKRQLVEGYGVDPLTAAGIEIQTDDAGSAGGSDAQADLLEEAGA